MASINRKDKLMLSKWAIKLTRELDEKEMVSVFPRALAERIYLIAEAKVRREILKRNKSNLKILTEVSKQLGYKGKELEKLIEEFKEGFHG